jgi:transcription initiation factor TFIIF subunit alpha
MSASPAGPPGPTPNGAPQAAPSRKPKPKANPLRPMNRPKKPAARRPAPGAVNRAAPPTGATPNAVQPTAAPSPNAPAARAFVQQRRSPSPEGQPQVFKLFMTKKDFADGLRYHVARLQSRKEVDILDEKEYTRPIRLHRRDRGDFLNGADAMDIDSKDELIDEKEREKAEAIKAERQRIREENAKLIAPTVNAKRKPQAFKKKTEQVYRANDTPEEQKRSLLRYEEALPWHLEDFDNKHIWEGAFQNTNISNNVLLMPVEGGGNAYRLIPIEKRYSFTERKVKLQPAEEKSEVKTEKKEKKLPQNLWVTQSQKERAQRKRQEMETKQALRLFVRKGGRDEEADFASDPFNAPEQAADANDIDFNYQEDFADDEENDLFEGDEEITKEAEKRIQREQLGANVFNQNDEKEVEEEEELEKKKREREKLDGKRTKKLLRKKGGDWTLYESDSDRGPGGLYEVSNPLAAAPDYG